MNYKVAENGEDLGFFSEEQILEQIGSGAIRTSAFVWREGMTDWLPVVEVFPGNVRPPLPISSVKPASQGGPHMLPKRSRSYFKWILIIGGCIFLKILMTLVSKKNQKSNSENFYSEDSEQTETVAVNRNNENSTTRYVGINLSPTGANIRIREVWDFKPNGRMDWSCAPVTGSRTSNLSVSSSGYFQVVNRSIQIHFDNGMDRQLEILNEDLIRGSGDESTYVKAQ